MSLFITDFFQTLFHTSSKKSPFIFNLCITLLAMWREKEENVSKFSFSYLSGSYFNPKTSATALYVTLPSTMFNPNARAGSSLQACRQPLHARATV